MGGDLRAAGERAGERGAAAGAALPSAVIRDHRHKLCRPIAIGQRAGVVVLGRLTASNGDAPKGDAPSAKPGRRGEGTRGLPEHQCAPVLDE